MKFDIKTQAFDSMTEALENYSNALMQAFKLTPEAKIIIIRNGELVQTRQHLHASTYKYCTKTHVKDANHES